MTARVLLIYTLFLYTAVFMRRLFLVTFVFVWLASTALAQQTVNERPLIVQSLSEEDSLFPGFSCTVGENNRVDLQWKKNNVLQADYFVIERSYDGTNYETVGVLRIGTDTAAQYRITDKPTENGSDFYRIKCSDESGSYRYSKVLQASLSAETDFKFYPNPADKMLIIKTAHDILMQIVDAKGLIRLNEKISPGIQVINVSSLEKGPYILKLTDKQSNRMVSEQLIKN
jgi:hypothetical protein